MSHHSPAVSDDAGAPLRVLMVADTPWDRRLGAPRVQIEFGEELSRLGHHVEHFSSDEAYSSPPPIARFAGVTRNFPRRAARYIRDNADRFDVIDARHGTVLAEPRGLGFTGLLVTRSTGLLPIYEREFVNADRRTPEARGKLLLRPLLRYEVREARRRSSVAFERADLISVLNAEEQAACTQMGYGDKTVKLPLGLNAARLHSFERLRGPVSERLAARRVAFIGSWDRRKGSHDMAAIVRGVLAAEPRAEFLFLGTGGTAEQVIDALGVAEARVDVRPYFGVDELPELLRDVTVAMLPSYVEGLPYAIVDALGAGLPTVAYDVPGSRELLPGIDRSLLVAPGATDRFAAKLVDVMTLDGPAYAELGASASAVAATLRWEDITRTTVGIYRERLARVRGRSSPPAERTARIIRSVHAVRGAGSGQPGAAPASEA